MNLNGFRIKKHLAFALVLTLVFFFTACGGGSSALVGKWTNEEGTVEFLKDGTGILGKDAITWKVENDRLYITSKTYLQARTLTFGYKISGSTLVLNSDDGENITLKKNK
jgi:hypothetical protein